MILNHKSHKPCLIADFNIFNINYFLSQKCVVHLSQMSNTFDQQLGTKLWYNHFKTTLDGVHWI